MDQLAYVGCRTNVARKAQGKGLGTFRIGPDGTWTALQLLEVASPSYLATDRAARWIYAVEGDEAHVNAFRRLPDGTLEAINSVDGGGRNPVHVAVSPDDRFVVVCNHVPAEGRAPGIVVLPIDADGALGEATDRHALTGEVGPNRTEQKSAKPHHAQFSPDGRLLAVADKGLDEVQFFALDAAGKLTWLEDHDVRMPWHAGPRDVAFHPTLPVMYLLNELDCTVVTITLEPKPTPVQRLSSQSDHFAPIFRGATIQVSPDGRTVYAGNRGPNTIGAFTVDQRTGLLSPTGWAASGGHVPRHFAVNAARGTLVVANEFSHDIAELPIAADGTLGAAVKRADFGSPTFVLLLDAPAS